MSFAMPIILTLKNLVVKPLGLGDVRLGAILWLIKPITSDMGRAM